MTEFATPVSLKELNDAKEKHLEVEKLDHGLNGGFSELKQQISAVAENQDPQKRALEQNDAIDLPHMDPSTHAPTTDSPTESPQVTPRPPHSPAIPNGIPAPQVTPLPPYSPAIPSSSPAIPPYSPAIPSGTPPHSPSLLNLQTNPPFPPLSPSITPPTGASPLLTPLPTSTSSTQPLTPLPSLSSTAPATPHTLTPLPSLSSTTPHTNLTPLPSLSSTTPATPHPNLTPLPSTATAPHTHTTGSHPQPHTATHAHPHTTNPHPQPHTATHAHPHTTNSHPQPHTATHAHTPTTSSHPQPHATHPHPHTAHPNVATPNHAKPAAASQSGGVATAGPTAMHTQLQLEKAQKDLARLRQHLMEMEEQHTLETEAMAEKIAQLESATQQNEKKGSSQDSTIQNLTATNERLSSALQEKELDLETTTAALYNLQTVLTQFQAQREEDIKNETQVLRNEAARANQQAAASKKELEAIQEKVKRMGELEGLTRSLQHELTEKTRTILAMQEEVEPLRKALNQYAEQLSQMARYEQNLVEKSVVTKLIVTYLSGGKKQEVLSLMARILNFTEEEMAKVGLISNKGWIPFLRSSASSLPSPRGTQERSVGDLWMEFLLKEVGETPGGQGQTDGKAVVS